MENNSWQEIIMTLHVLCKDPCSEPKKLWLEIIQTDTSSSALRTLVTRPNKEE